MSRVVRHLLVPLARCRHDSHSVSKAFEWVVAAHRSVRLRMEMERRYVGINKPNYHADAAQSPGAGWAQADYKWNYVGTGMYKFTYFGTSPSGIMPYARSESNAVLLRWT